MKNYPNQAVSFDRIRSTLATIRDLSDSGADVTDDGILGYELARRKLYTFRNLDYATATTADIEARIVGERAKSPSDQGARTNARELRRTLHDMDWLDSGASVTSSGIELLDSEPGSVDEQSLLVAALLEIQAIDSDGNSHHPVSTMLQLLAIQPSLHRHGLELALEPLNDTTAEFERVAALYSLGQDARMAALGITDYQRANAVKIFPSLATTAGLVVEENGYFSLTQDGWQILGQGPAQAKTQIAKHRGRRTTVGKLVKSSDVAADVGGSPPKTLSAEEQLRAAERLAERTTGHQSLVRRVAAMIGDDRGDLFEDKFSYDLLWRPTGTDSSALPAFLFEMKTVTSDTPAQVRRAVGQLSYYEYFHVAPKIAEGAVQRVAAFDEPIDRALVDYLSHENIAVVVSKPDSELVGLNPLGMDLAARLRPNGDASSRVRHTQA